MVCLHIMQPAELFNYCGGDVYYPKNPNSLILILWWLQFQSVHMWKIYITTGHCYEKHVFVTSRMSTEASISFQNDYCCPLVDGRGTDYIKASQWSESYLPREPLQIPSTSGGNLRWLEYFPFPKMFDIVDTGARCPSFVSAAIYNGICRPLHLVSDV